MEGLREGEDFDHGSLFRISFITFCVVAILPFFPRVVSLFVLRKRCTQTTTTKRKHMVSICPLMLPQKHVGMACGEVTREGCDDIACAWMLTVRHFVIIMSARQQSTQLQLCFTYTQTHTIYFIQLLRVSYVMESKNHHCTLFVLMAQLPQC